MLNTSIISDRTDAFSLALTYYNPAFDERRWINWRCDLSGDLNRTLLDIKGLEVTSTPIVNQLRQRLKHEFPQVANRTIGNNRTDGGFTAWVGYLAGIHTYKRIENERARSIATQLSIEISDHTRSRARHLVDHQVLEAELHERLKMLLAHPDLERYIPALDRIGFGSILKAAILSNIHPFEKFLSEGKRVISSPSDRSDLI